MSGRWMTAGDRLADYRSDVVGAVGNGVAGNLVTRAVLRELCRIAHDAGIAQVSVPALATRLGTNERTVRRALQRLQDDHFLTRAVRGTGNRHGTQPRATVWVLHQLPDVQGDLWPQTEWLQLQWSVYVRSARWDSLNRANRQAVRDAWTGVDNSRPAGLLADSTGPTSGQHCPHSSQGGSQLPTDPPPPLIVDRPARWQAVRDDRRRRALIAAVPTKDPPPKGWTTGLPW